MGGTTYLERVHEDRYTGSLLTLPSQDHLEGHRAYAERRINVRDCGLEDLLHDGVCLFHIELAPIEQLAS